MKRSSFVSHADRPVTVGGRLASWLKKGLDLIAGRRDATDLIAAVEARMRHRESRAIRHRGLDIAALRRRRAKNKVGRRSRRINRIRSGR